MKKGKLYSEEEVKRAVEKRTKGIQDKYISKTDYNSWKKIIESKHKKDFRILLRAIQSMGKTIKKLKEQELFLNDLLDERERTIRKNNILDKELDASTEVNE